MIESKTCPHDSRSSNGIDAELFVRHARYAVLIVRVVSGHKKFIGKILVE